MAKHWRIHPHDPERIASLQRTAGIPAVVAQLLVARGVSDAAAVRDFLDVRLTSLRDPGTLSGTLDAAARIAAAIEARRKIVIYGDYDVDGMTGTSLLYLCLKMLSANVSYYVPNRIDEGYGLHADSLVELAKNGAQMVITVDCGICSVVEALKARELGLELIVTDHHDLPAELPDAAAIVHARVPHGHYPFAGLCGAGVAFKVAWAVCRQASHAKKVSDRMRNFLMQAMGLVALATVADVVPLVDENRTLVRHGLTSLKQQPSAGIAALLKVAGLTEKPFLSSEDIAFAIAPRLNAAGRLGQAPLAIELLTTDSPERATILAEYLQELNSNRETLDRSIYLAANKQAQEHFETHGEAALVLADRNWHPGVIGIVAGRLAEKYHRPVVLIAFDQLGLKPGVGSARSVPGFDLGAALAACGHHLASHGGHAAAAGLKIEERNLDAFRADFCEYVGCAIPQSARQAELRIDAEVPFSGLTLETLQHLERLAPFGHANPRPVFCTTNVSLAEPPRRIGGGERHLSLRLVQHGIPLRAIAFGGAERAEEFADQEGNFAVAFRPIINHFRGRRSVELQLCDWRAAAVPVG